MAITEIYAGTDQVDFATLTSGGITYHCEAWVGRGGARIEAKVFAESEDGAIVLIDAAVVALPVGEYVDCARVLAVPSTNTFAVHWIDMETTIDGGGVESVDSAVLHRSLFDVTAFATGWVAQGSVALYSTLQYDAYPVEGSSGATAGFVVVRRTAVGTISIDRYDAPFSWVDTAFASVSVAGLTIANTVLGCWSHESADVILVGYQDGTTLRVRRHVASTGVVGAVGILFAGLDTGANQFAVLAFERLASGSYAAVVEANSNANNAAGGRRTYLRLVGWCSFDASIATTGGPDWGKNLSMASRPWVTASGFTGTNDLFVAAGFKSVEDGQEFDQGYGYVVRLPIGPTGDGAGQVRPIPHTAIMGGSFDARPHGSIPTGSVLNIGARINHVSSVGGPPQYTLGPNVKTRIFGCVRWGRFKLVLDAGSGELTPIEAGAGYVRFHYEPAWTIRRDALEPTQPDTPAWKGVSKALSLPLEIPSGLLLTGGVAQAYDGEQLVEAGFMWAPEIMGATAVGAGGAMDDAETYYWFANYIWPDNRGGIHRGGPSRPVSAAVVLNGYATLRIRCCNLSLKDDTARYPAAHPIGIEIWRTYVDGGSLATEGSGDNQTYLFRSDLGGTIASGPVSTPSSDWDEWYVDVDVGRPNSEVSLNELAPYQLDLDALQWVPPPPIPHQPLGPSCLWQGRVFGQDPESGSLVWSEEILPTGSRYAWPIFLDTNAYRLDGLGEVTALCPLENDLAIFTRDGVFLLSGDPGAGGSGNTFTLRFVARGIGCVDMRSIASFTEGCTFQSAKGRIHVLTRGSGLEDIGGPIEDLLREAGNVRSAVYLEDRDEIRFTLQEEPGTGPLLVRPRIATFNLRTKIWVVRNLPMVASSSTASRLNEMMHATPWRGRQGETIHVVLAQGGLFVERAATSTVYSDETVGDTTTTIRLDATTEWIHVSMLDGTKRIYEIGIQTERTHAGALTVEAWYDHDGSFDSDDGAAEQTLAVASPAPAFIRFRPRPSKCRAIKLRIYEPEGVPATENVRLVALTLHYGVLSKRQGSRNSAA
jgi:hypothetical protein